MGGTSREKEDHQIRLSLFMNQLQNRIMLLDVVFVVDVVSTKKVEREDVVEGVQIPRSSFKIGRVACGHYNT